mgnify:FL=1
MSETIVIFIVLVIIALQIYFFRKNVLRMREYKEIFGKEKTWGIAHNAETNFVSGIYGKGNSVFTSIKDSINKYLGNNSGSIIDFTLLKDTVDRHCDSVENDINTLTPVPLYCGLAGTMGGVIVGLYSLLSTGSITDLLSSGSSNFGAAAEGVNELLSGVALAMLASICGIFLTTLGSILFKRYKLQEESGKNTFLAWLQAKLLPELPSDTSDALNRLVKNLNKFNNTFATNTTELRGALTQVNESYRIQGDIIKAVHDMDVMKMAKANIRVLEELKDCTDKLEVFNQYLDDIHGYTDAIHTFTTQFEQESNRLHVLEEIRNYFIRHKAEIAKDSADVDIALRNALKDLKETAGSNAKELNYTLVQQAEEFKQILKEEKESFEKVNNEIKAQFAVQLNQIPMLEKKLGEISAIPSKLDILINRIEQSNITLASNVKNTMNQTIQGLLAGFSKTSGSSARNYVTPILPSWMKWTIIVSVILIAIACISNTAYNIWYTSTQAKNIEMSNEELNAVTDSTSLMNQELHNVPEKMIQQNDQQTPKQPILKVKDQKNNGDTNIQSINKVESSNGKSKKDI